MFQWGGADDATRVSADGMSASEVDKRVRLVTKYTLKDVLPNEPVVPPFDASNPPPEVQLCYVVAYFLDCVFCCLPVMFADLYCLYAGLGGVALYASPP